MPVHSIGHGTVTYAAPRGWGADGGVVIVRHVFPDGSTILSFYGHLDPPSVVLNAGACVERGDQVGQIGRPRSPPHLHFEIRSHMPTTPGPGYWSVDPTLAGWEPPSQYIWNYRMAVSPGVEWTRPSDDRDTRGFGMLNHDTFVAIEGDHLTGIDLVDGGLLWTQPISKTVVDATIDTGRSTLYVSNYFGQIQAFHPPDLQDSSKPSSAPIWNIELDAVGGATLMPLPGGGVAASFRQQMFGISAAGVVLWELDAGVRVFYWVLGDDQLVFSTLGEENSTWAVNEAEPMALAAQIGGRPIIVGDQVWVYDEDGIYRLDPETRSAELLYALPRATLKLGDLTALPDGGVLVAHVDPFDKRLIALNAEGTLRWQISFSHIAHYQQKLLVLDGRAYLVSYDASLSFSELSIYAIDLNSAKLVHIFTSGSRYPLPRDTWAFPISENRILINIAGGNMAVLDLQMAIEAVTQAANSQ